MFSSLSLGKFGQFLPGFGSYLNGNKLRWIEAEMLAKIRPVFASVDPW